MGLDMIERLRDVTTPHGDALEIRVGMHVGPAVGGVIGLKKFIYDVWGHTVNTASRMESHGLPGRLQVTESARQRLEPGFVFEPRGTVEVKGVGPMMTYLLVGPAA
jgi:class 3 adenylate cyclase